MTRTLTLPCLDGSLAPFTCGAPRAWPTADGALPQRVAYAAAHVVADPRRDVDVFTENAIDWDATLAYRRHLWKLRLRRRRGDGHRAARRRARLEVGAGADPALAGRGDAPRAATIAFGAGTDHLAPTPSVTLDDVRARVRGAGRLRRERRRTRDPHGEPRAGAARRARPTTTARSTAACCGRCSSR